MHLADVRKPVGQIPLSIRHAEDRILADIKELLRDGDNVSNRCLASRAYIEGLAVVRFAQLEPDVDKRLGDIVDIDKVRDTRGSTSSGYPPDAPK
jgi:hypothetical protein